MDFGVKKLILEEGMKNIAETEGVKLDMSFDSFTKTVTVDFSIPLQRYLGGVHKACSYCDIEHEDADIFKTIEDTRREVQDMKNPIGAGFRNGLNKPTPAEESALMRALRSFSSDKLAKHYPMGKCMPMPKIKNVIFNYPATIVFWEDGDKTVVKCQNDDVFDAEKGLAMAIIKKMNGGKGNYCEIFKPWCSEYEKQRSEAFFKEQDEHMLKLRKVALEEGDIISEANTDIMDILEGKVDPLMIKVDEEEEKPVEKSCVTCDHKHKKVYESPCKRCLEDTNGVLPKWEPKKKETKAPDVVKKTCWNCANHSFEKDKEPCCSCTTRRRNGTIHRNWEPKE